MLSLSSAHTDPGVPKHRVDRLSGAERWPLDGNHTDDPRAQPMSASVRAPLSCRDFGAAHRILISRAKSCVGSTAGGARATSSTSSPPVVTRLAPE